MSVRRTSWDVELKVLGQVRAIGTKEPLSPTELHLAIYLAFNRSGENADTIATMLWPNGINPRTLTNAMASLRRKLGTGADGEPLFPLGRDNQYVSALRTGRDRLGSIRRARRAGPTPSTTTRPCRCSTKRSSSIDGPPFRAATGYSWAYSDGTATMISDTVRAASSRAAQLHDSAATWLAPHKRGIALSCCSTGPTTIRRRRAPLAPAELSVRDRPLGDAFHRGRCCIHQRASGAERGSWANGKDREDRRRPRLDKYVRLLAHVEQTLIEVCYEAELVERGAHWRRAILQLSEQHVLLAFERCTAE